jgi:hypothetical protein
VERELLACLAIPCASIALELWKRWIREVCQLSITGYHK